MTRRLERLDNLSRSQVIDTNWATLLRCYGQQPTLHAWFAANRLTTVVFIIKQACAAGRPLWRRRSYQWVTLRGCNHRVTRVVSDDVVVAIGHGRMFRLRGQKLGSVERRVNNLLDPINEAIYGTLRK